MQQYSSAGGSDGCLALPTLQAKQLAPITSAQENNQLEPVKQLLVEPLINQLKPRNFWYTYHNSNCAHNLNSVCITMNAVTRVLLQQHSPARSESDTHDQTISLGH